MDPLRVVQALYEAFEARDEAALRAVLHPDVEWHQCPGFPGGDRRSGVEQVLAKVFSGLRSEWEDFAAPVEEYLACGDHVVALGRYRGRHGRTGREMEAVFAHVYEVRAGRIVRYRQYADTWPMVAAARGEANDSPFQAATVVCRSVDAADALLLRAEAGAMLAWARAARLVAGEPRIVARRAGAGFEVGIAVPDGTAAPQGASRALVSACGARRAAPDGEDPFAAWLAAGAPGVLEVRLGEGGRERARWFAARTA